MVKHSMMFAALTLSAASWGGSVAEALAQADSTYVHLKDVEVTANRATRTTPVAYTNVSKETLNSQNDGRDLPYLLQSTPSLITTSDAGAGMGYTSLRIRGTEGSRINVTLNGIPINNPESHNVYWVDMPDLASSLSSIQVQRGVGTSTNGAAAFGASVNMTTDAPSEQSYAELSGAYGSYNTQRECLRVGSGLINGHWTFDAKISHQASDGYIDRASSKLWSYLGQAAYISRKTLLRLIAFGGKEQTYMAWDYASKEQMKEFGRRYNPCGAYTDANGNTAYYDNQNDYYIQHHLQLHLAQQLSDRWNMTAALHYTRDDGYYEQYKAGAKFKKYNLASYDVYDAATGSYTTVKKSDLVRLKYNENDFTGVTFSFNYTSDRLKWTTGGAANYYEGDHYGRIAWIRNYVGTLDARQKYYDNTGRKTDVNVYTRADYRLTDALSAFADLQYRNLHYKINGVSDEFNDDTDALDVLDVHRTWNFFNPKVGLNYEQGNNRLYASWSVAHREPMRNNFTEGDHSHNPSAERLFDYEVGYAYNSRLFSVGLNYYYMDYKDQLVATGELSDTGNPLTVNVPDSYRTGVELQGSYRPAKWFDWSLNATLSRNRIKNYTYYLYDWDAYEAKPFTAKSAQIAYSPDFIGNNVFHFHVQGFDASLATKYVSKQYMSNVKDDALKIDAYCVSDLHLSYTFRKIAGVEALTLGCHVYNLFNEEYENYGYVYDSGLNADGTPYYDTRYSAQAPTHVMGTVTLKF